MSCDNHPASRDVSLLAEPFRSRVQAWLRANPGINVHEAARTAERQSCLRTAGSTWVARSRHQDGYAVDVHFRTEPHFPPSGDARWVPIRQSAQAHGIISGFDLWGTDGNHFEMINDITTQFDPVPDATISEPTNMLQSDQMEENSALWHDLEAIEQLCQAMRGRLHAINERWRSLDSSA